LHPICFIFAQKSAASQEGLPILHISNRSRYDSDKDLFRLVASVVHRTGPHEHLAVMSDT
jgi:hypothetical protein